MDPVDELRSREAIREVLYRYCHGLDRREWQDVIDCFHPGAVDNHGYMTGSVHDLIAWIKPRHEAIPQSMHSITNVLIEFLDDDRALVESYCLAYQTIARPGKPNVRSSIACRYIDVFTRIERLWRIARRDVSYEWVRTEEETSGAREQETPSQSRRDRHDLYFQVKEAAAA